MCVEDAQDLSDHGLECVREVLYKYRHMVPSRKRGIVADGIRFFTGLRLALHQTQDSDGSTFPVLLSRDEALQPPGHDVPHFRRVALGGTYEQWWFAFQESLHAQEVLREHSEKFDNIPVVTDVLDKLQDVLLEIHSGVTLKGHGLRMPRLVGVCLTEAAIHQVATQLPFEAGLAASSIDKLRNLCYVCRFMFRGVYNVRVAELLLFLDGVKLLLSGATLPASLVKSPPSRTFFPLDDPANPARLALSCW
eukprot:s287_g27.t1